MASNIISFGKVKEQFFLKLIKMNIEDDSIIDFYDFGDGNIVKAHRHINGGGIVADTCDIDESVYISSDCHVYGNVVIKGNVIIDSSCDISGNIIINSIGEKGINISDFTSIEGNINIIGSYSIQKTTIYANKKFINKGKRQIRHYNKTIV